MSIDNFVTQIDQTLMYCHSRKRAIRIGIGRPGIEVMMIQIVILSIHLDDNAVVQEDSIRTDRSGQLPTHSVVRLVGQQGREPSQQRQATSKQLQQQLLLPPPLRRRRM